MAINPFEINDLKYNTDLDGFSNFLVLNSFLDTLEVLVESTLKSNHDLDASLGASINGLDGFGEIGSNGLFAKDMFAIGGTSLDLLGMETRGRANPDGVNLRVSDDIHSIAGESGDAVLGGS
jgi:hypothetical protein